MTHADFVSVIEKRWRRKRRHEREFHHRFTIAAEIREPPLIMRPGEQTEPCRGADIAQFAVAVEPFAVVLLRRGGKQNLSGKYRRATPAVVAEKSRRRDKIQVKACRQ